MKKENRLISPGYAGKDIEIQKLDLCIKGFSYEELKSELWQYFVQNEADEYEGIPLTEQNIMDFIRPQVLIINGENTVHPNYGIICDCIWDEEHGISIILSEDKIRIEPDIAELA